mmetsp:Transcript_12920/g.29728  ORF Transcript_12920/g.29728 Transcript_12920/m.29728 type:complete len:410 (-) Transcript_12920:1292-2521(-)
MRSRSRSALAFSCARSMSFTSLAIISEVWRSSLASSICRSFSSLSFSRSSFCTSSALSRSRASRSLSSLSACSALSLFWWSVSANSLACNSFRSRSSSSSAFFFCTSWCSLSSSSSCFSMAWITKLALRLNDCRRFPIVSRPGDLSPSLVGHIDLLRPGEHSPSMSDLGVPAAISTEVPRFRGDCDPVLRAAPALAVPLGVSLSQGEGCPSSTTTCGLGDPTSTAFGLRFFSRGDASLASSVLPLTGDFPAGLTGVGLPPAAFGSVAVFFSTRDFFVSATTFFFVTALSSLLSAAASLPDGLGAAALALSAATLAAGVLSPALPRFLASAAAAGAGVGCFFPADPGVRSKEKRREPVSGVAVSGLQPPGSSSSSSPSPSSTHRLELGLFCAGLLLSTGGPAPSASSGGV